MTDSIRASIEAASAYLTEHPDEAGYTDSLATATVVDGLHVRVSGPSGEILETDMPAAGRRDGIGGESRMVVSAPPLRRAWRRWRRCGRPRSASRTFGARWTWTRSRTIAASSASTHRRPPARSRSGSVCAWLRVTRHRATSRNWGRGRSSIVRSGAGPRGARDADGRPRVTSVVVRDARPNDADAIARVARASWTHTYRAIFDPGFIEDFLSRNYAVDHIAEAAGQAEQRGAIFLVAERGEVVAYLHFGVGERGPELSRIYADEAFGTGATTPSSTSSIAASMSVGSAATSLTSTRATCAVARSTTKGFVIVGEGSTPDCNLTLRRTSIHRDPAFLSRPSSGCAGSRTPTPTRERLHAIYGDAETMRYIGPRVARPRISRRRANPSRAGSARGAPRLQPLGRRRARRGAARRVAGLAWVEGHGPDVEAAYLVRRDRWGLGYATEALQAVLEVGFGQLGLPSIVALAYPANDRSRRVMERAGMRAHGTVSAYSRELTRHVATP